MKVYILWYQPLHNYDDEPWQIYDILSSEEKAKINIEEWSVK